MSTDAKGLLTREELQELLRDATPGDWRVRGVSMEDGSISIGSEEHRIVIAYVTNAASLGDFVSAAMRGRRDFGAPDTAVSQWANARLIAAVRRIAATALHYMDRSLASPVPGDDAVERVARAISQDYCEDYLDEGEREEVRERARAALTAAGPGQDHPLCARTLEKAAEVAENPTGVWWHGYDSLNDAIAAEIRALAKEG